MPEWSVLAAMRMHGPAAISSTASSSDGLYEAAPGAADRRDSEVDPRAVCQRQAARHRGRENQGLARAVRRDHARPRLCSGIAEQRAAAARDDAAAAREVKLAARALSSSAQPLARDLLTSGLVLDLNGEIRTARQRPAASG